MTEKTDAERALFYIVHEIADYVGDLVLIADGEFDEPEPQRKQAEQTIRILESWREKIEKIEQGGRSEYDSAYPP